ncbi:MAG: glycosyltransferase [Thermomicrobia bacterium]|nr:glycosyltransferase [Thermomicrobia bacterium]
MAMQSPSLSVIICAYTEDRWDDLVAAVASVQQQTVLVGEIIVVVDHNEALLARAHARLTGAYVIENAASRGLSGARNSGIAVARGEVIAFLDDDARAAPDWLERLVLQYRDPRIIGVGGAIEPMWVGQRPGWFPAEFEWVVGCTYRGIGDEDAPVRNLIGANMSFRRSVFEAIGGFREGLGRAGQNTAGCEETELCIRAARHWPQKQFLYIPAARVYHRVPESRAAWRYFYRRCFGEGRAKALVARSVGKRDALASERRYTTHTLPIGVYGALCEALRGNLAGITRAAAIVAGLAITTSGYLLGAFSRMFAPVHAEDERDISVSYSVSRSRM